MSTSVELVRNGPLPPARAVGRKQNDGRSEIHRGRSSGPLRLLFPRTAGRAAWVVTSSLGGGMVDGDEVRLELDVGPDAACLLTSQASQKIYRGVSRVEIDAAVAERGALLSVPDPTVPYRGATLTQKTKIALGEGASLAWMDVVTAGRVARGERWSSGTLDVGVELTRAGRVVLRDRLLLDPARCPLADKMGRFDAIGTVILVGPAFADLAADALEALGRGDRDVLLGGGTVDDGVLVRVATTNVADAIRCTRDLVRGACARFAEDPFGRKW